MHFSLSTKMSEWNKGDIIGDRGRLGWILQIDNRAGCNNVIRTLSIAQVQNVQLYFIRIQIQ